MKKRLISFDWAIKKVLRNKANFEILEGFLSELIAPDKNLKIIKLLESESNKDVASDKLNRVDILVEIVPDDLVLIEVQVNRELDFLHRMLFGTSKVITEYLDEGQAYAQIKKVYSVNILYFDLGQGTDYVYKGTTNFIGIHNQEQLQLSFKQQQLYQKSSISAIYPEYYIIKVNNFNNLAKNTLDEWIYFLKNEEIKTDFNAKGLLKAKREFDILNLLDEERNAYDVYQNNLHYHASMMESNYSEGKYDGKQQGLEQGLEQGLQQGLEQGLKLGREEGWQQGKLDVARYMLSKGLTKEEVSKLTDITVAMLTNL